MTCIENRKHDETLEPIEVFMGRKKLRCHVKSDPVPFDVKTENHALRTAFENGSQPFGYAPAGLGEYGYVPLMRNITYGMIYEYHYYDAEEEEEKEEKKKEEEEEEEEPNHITPLMTIKVEDEYVMRVDINRGEDLTISIPRGYLFLNDHLFYDQKKIQKVILPDTIRNLGGYCFMHSSVEYVEGLENTSIEVIPAYCFSRSAIRSLHLPPTVKQIHLDAFAGCMDLTAVEGLAETQVDTLADDCFRYCPKLTAIELPPCLRAINDNAFMYTPLRELTLPEKLEYLESWCIPDSIKKLTIPDSLTYIGEYNFTALSELWCTPASLEVALQGSNHTPIDMEICCTLKDGRVFRFSPLPLNEKQRQILPNILVYEGRKSLTSWLKDLCLSKDLLVRIPLLARLAQDILHGEEKELVEKTVKPHAGKVAKQAYLLRNRKDALLLLENYPFTQKMLDSLLQMANERGDASFAAVVLEKKNKGTEGKPSSFRL